MLSGTDRPHTMTPSFLRYWPNPQITKVMVIIIIILIISLCSVKSLVTPGDLPD